MLRKRPCSICRRWFRPTARAGDRQKVCSGEACQRERHRRSCLAWRENNPDYDRAERLRKKLQAAAPLQVEATLNSPPLRGLPLPVVRDVVGLEVAVIVEKLGQVAHSWARDVVTVEIAGIHREFRRHDPSGARDAYDEAGPIP